MTAALRDLGLRADAAAANAQGFPLQNDCSALTGPYWP